MSSIYIPIQTDDVCSDAMYDPYFTDSNADVDGVAVAAANVVIALCLRIQVSFAPAEIDTGVQATLLQTYPILLAALFSINQNELSLFDVNFALDLAFSPLTVSLVSSSIGEAMGIKTDLYGRIKSHRLVIRVLGTLLPALWLALSGIARLSDGAFTDSYACEGSTFDDWVRDVIQELAALVVVGGPFPFSYLMVLVPFALLLFRRRFQIKEEVRDHFTQRERTPLGICRMVWLILDAPWDVIGFHHRWFTLMFLVYADIGWGIGIVMPAMSALDDDYILSYGQILSVITAVPPFLSTVKLVCSYRGDPLLAIRRFPKSFWNEVVYLISGKEPDPLVWKNRLPLTNSHCHRESPPVESQQPEDSTADLPSPPAHQEPQPNSILAPPALCVPLVMVRDLVSLLLRSEAAVESVELVCADHSLSPQATGFIVQVIEESLPPPREQQMSRNLNGSNSFTTGAVTHPQCRPAACVVMRVITSPYTWVRRFHVTVVG